MERTIAAMRDHVIVCGWGRVGRAIASEVATAGRELVVIDHDAGRLTDCPHATVLGDATQDAVLATFDRILRALTLAVGALAAISLAVAGILIMNVMLISVTQRRREIGLLRALGASGAQIRAVFFTEAVLLALGGAALGLAAGKAGQLVVAQIYPAIPFTPPWWALLAAPLTSIATAVLFAIAPARHAARLDPVQALSRR